MHDLLALKRLTSLIKFLRMNFMDLLHYLKNIKMLYHDLFFFLGKWIQNRFDKKWVEGFKNLVNILGIQIFYETAWKWIAYFELNVICKLFVFYSSVVTYDCLVIT